MRLRIGTIAVAAGLLAGAAQAEDYVSTVMTRDLRVPAALAWQRIGGFCDLSKFLPLSCSYGSGTGTVGTVRKVAMGPGKGGEEVMVGQTARSYTYAMRNSPVFYHATFAVEPAGAKSSKLIYTFVWDQSSLDADGRAKDKAMRDQIFVPALDKAKKVAEGR